MPAVTRLVIGGHKNQSLILRSVSNAVFAIFIALRDASGRMLRDILRLTCTIARGVASALRNVPRRS